MVLYFQNCLRYTGDVDHETRQTIGVSIFFKAARVPI